MQDDENYKSGNDRLATHLVGIHVKATYPNDSTIHTALCSSFILEIEGEWFLVTAGHFLSRLQEALSKGAKLTVQLADGLTSKSTSKFLLPFNFQIESTFFLDESGLDYGLIPLDMLTRMNMERNGCKSLAKDSWNSLAPMEYEHVLLGLPSELLNNNVKNGFELAHTAIQVEPLKTCPPNITPQRGLSFFGRLIEPFTVADIDGMSGSPIFAIGKNAEGKNVYWLVAVQSRWHRSSREIAGCLIEPFTQEVEKIIKEIKRKAV